MQVTVHARLPAPSAPRSHRRTSIVTRYPHRPAPYDPPSSPEPHRAAADAGVSACLATRPARHRCCSPPPCAAPLSKLSPSLPRRPHLGPHPRGQEAPCARACILSKQHLPPMRRQASGLLLAGRAGRYAERRGRRCVRKPSRPWAPSVPGFFVREPEPAGLCTELIPLAALRYLFARGNVLLTLLLLPTAETLRLPSILCFCPIRASRALWMCRSRLFRAR